MLKLHSASHVVQVRVRNILSSVAKLVTNKGSSSLLQNSACESSSDFKSLLYNKRICASCMLNLDKSTLLHSNTSNVAYLFSNANIPNNNNFNSSYCNVTCSGVSHLKHNNIASWACNNSKLRNRIITQILFCQTHIIISQYLLQHSQVYTPVEIINALIYQ